MKCAAPAAVLLAAGYGAYSQENATFATAVLPVLKNSCEPCHNPIEGSGGLNVRAIENEESLTTDRELWGRVLRRVRDGQMPPRRVARPAGIDEFVAYLERELEGSKGSLRER
jgi:hypothetical protein